VRLAEGDAPYFIRVGSTDLLVLEEIFGQREYDAVLKQLRRVRLVVDLGANAGFSLRLWHQSYPGCRMVAVEPDPGNCDIARRNLRAAGLLNSVTLVQACVGYPARRARFGGGEEWSYAIEGQADDGEGTTEVLTLEQILSRHAPDEEIDLLKCDIEGAEAEVFGHCHAWIRRVRVIVVELHAPYREQQLVSDIAAAGGRFEVLARGAKPERPVLVLRRRDPADAARAGEDAP
jgi:FkbM family methyltransferase